MFLLGSIWMLSFLMFMVMDNFMLYDNFTLSHLCSVVVPSLWIKAPARVKKIKAHQGNMWILQKV